MKSSIFNKQFLGLLVALMSLCGLWGCSSADEPVPADEPLPAQPQPIADADNHRTTLVYMVANNNLNSFATADIKEMCEAMRNMAAPTGRLLVYYAPLTHAPQLLEIMPGGEKTVLIQYDSSISSATIERMQQAIADTKELAPAPGYGLVLWSHGTGWMNDDGVIDESGYESGITTQSFGADGYYNTKRMSITSLAKALDGTKWDFIYFDCCHMATVEVIYQLRHATDHMIASAAEIGGEGMPYDLNVPVFLDPRLDVAEVMNNTFGYYKTYQPDNGDDGCTISFINTTTIDDLASATREIYLRYGSAIPSYTPVTYCRTALTGVKRIYDMYDYISALCPDHELLSRWQEAFGRVVARHLTTGSVYFMNADKFHGLGTNILDAASESEIFGYDTMQWWHDVAQYAFNK